MSRTVPYLGMPAPTVDGPMGRAECPDCDGLVATVLTVNRVLPNDRWGCPRFVTLYRAHRASGVQCVGSRAAVDPRDVLTQARAIPRKINPQKLYGA